MDFRELFILLRPNLQRELKNMLDCRKNHKGISNDQKRKIKAYILQKNAKPIGRPRKIGS